MKQCAVELAKITAAAEIPKVTKKGAFRGWACYIERGLECRREVPTGHLNNFSSRANKYNKKKAQNDDEDDHKHDNNDDDDGQAGRDTLGLLDTRVSCLQEHKIRT